MHFDPPNVPYFHLFKKMGGRRRKMGQFSSNLGGLAQFCVQNLEDAHFEDLKRKSKKDDNECV